MIILWPTIQIGWPVAGEQLVLHRFPSGTMGLTSPRPSLRESVSCSGTPAVCVPPGARLLLQDIPKNYRPQSFRHQRS